VANPVCYWSISSPGLGTWHYNGRSWSKWLGDQEVTSLVHFNGKWTRYKLPWPLSRRAPSAG
jgi:hypothetical protein